MKKIEEVQKLRRAQQVRFTWKKIGTVILIIFGWLILASSIGGLDPHGSLWWLQIILIVAAIVGCVKLPRPYKPVPFPEITYQDKIEFAGLIDTATHANNDFISFLRDTIRLNDDEWQAIVASIDPFTSEGKMVYRYTPTVHNEQAALRLLTSYLSFRQVPEENARDIVKEAMTKIHSTIEAYKRVYETVPYDYLIGYQKSTTDVYEAARKEQQEQERQAQNPRYIPRGVMTEVWNRDGGKCVRCGSQQGLEFDHIIPVSLGGSSTANNVQLLCQSCNRTKGNREVG